MSSAVTADTLPRNADDANADADDCTTVRGNEGSSKAPLEYARLLIELGEVPNFNTKNSNSSKSALFSQQLCLSNACMIRLPAHYYQNYLRVFSSLTLSNFLFCLSFYSTISHISTSFSALHTRRVAHTHIAAIDTSHHQHRLAQSPDRLWPDVLEARRHFLLARLRDASARMLSALSPSHHHHHHQQQQQHQINAGAGTVSMQSVSHQSEATSGSGHEKASGNFGGGGFESNGIAMAAIADGFVRHFVEFAQLFFAIFVRPSSVSSSSVSSSSASSSSISSKEPAVDKDAAKTDDHSSNGNSSAADSALTALARELFGALFSTVRKALLSLANDESTHSSSDSSASSGAGSGSGAGPSSGSSNANPNHTGSGGKGGLFQRPSASSSSSSSSSSSRRLAAELFHFYRAASAAHLCVPNAELADRASDLVEHCLRQAVESEFANGRAGTLVGGGVIGCSQSMYQRRSEGKHVSPIIVAF